MPVDGIVENKERKKTPQYVFMQISIKITYKINDDVAAGKICQVCLYFL